MPAFNSSSPVVNEVISPVFLIAAFQKSTTTAAASQWQSHTITYSFPTVGSQFIDGLGYGDGQVSAGWTPFNNIQKTAARMALAAWASVADVNFVEVADGATVGDIRFTFTNNLPAGTGGVAYFPNGNAYGGDIWISSNYVNSSFVSSGEPSQYNFLNIQGYEALLHEVGHALGLSHPNEKVGINQQLFPALYDNNLYTLMSYLFNTDRVGVPKTPMTFDIRAIQHLYGANTTSSSGNNTYTYDIDDINFSTIWDSGGIDTLVVTDTSKVANEIRFKIDIREAGVSGIGFADSFSYNFRSPSDPLAIKRGDGVVAIAYGTVIENIITTDFNEDIYGNSANNTIYPGLGSDQIFGGDGIDTVVYNKLHSDFIYSAVGVISSVGTQVSITPKTPRFTSFGAYIPDNDAMQSIERLRFTDSSVAFDLLDGGRAGMVAKTIGAVFGKATVTNKQYVGIGLFKLDEGQSYKQLMQLALNAKLGINPSNTDVVNLLYTNVVGKAPTFADFNVFKNLLDTGAMTQADLGLLAADHALNVTSIGLVGLAHTGLEYIPFAG